MDEFSPTLVFSAGGVSTFIAILFLLIKYPDHVEKWSGMLVRFFGFLFRKSQYFSVKREIEGKLNIFASSLETDGGVPYNKVVITWTGREEDQEVVFEDGQTILVIRDRNHRNKNFVHAAYFYASEILLKNTKRKLSKHLKTSLDLFSTKKIIEAQNRDALNQFTTDFLIPIVDEHEKVKEYMERFNKIDTIGLYAPVLIQELTYLGSKVYLSVPQQEVLEEVERLIQFLERWSEREIGQSTQEEFTGKYTKCSIKIVASFFSRIMEKLDRQRSRINGAFNAGCENVYVIGNGEKDSRKFIDKVIEGILENSKALIVVKKLKFTAVLKKGGRKEKVPNYLVHIRNPEAIEYVS